jgi:predicted PurR-regulated permease PerM
MPSSEAIDGGLAAFMNNLAKRLGPWLQVAAIVLMVGILYFGQAILVPIALAGLFTFLLSPVVAFLQRYLGRVAAVLVVVALSFSATGATAWSVAGELRALAHELPAYRHTIRQRIVDLRGASRGSAVEKVQETVKDLKEAIESEASPKGREKPVAVKTVETTPDLWRFPTAVGPLLDALATAGLVVILAVFMLLEQQELRNRIISLVGSGRVSRATTALDEAGSRISRYLFRQSIINGIFGLGVGTGLALLGVPHAVLWGLLATMLRFVPYIGPWIAALAPITLSLAVFPGWVRPLLVAALFVVFELFTNIVLETLLYAGAAGVSQVGLLVAIAFWTWIWGPAGLLMATPLTVCLVVLARHIPSMEFLATLLGDQPALSTDVAYYQRLLADDSDEATAIVEATLEGSDLATAFDTVMLPALNYVRRDAGELSSVQEQNVLRGTATILDDLQSSSSPQAADLPSLPRGTASLTVLGCPARSEVDEIALRMWEPLLDSTRVTLDVSSSRSLSSEVVALVKEHAYPAVCVVALPPGGLTHAKYLCKKLRAAFPDLKILAGRWGPPGLGGEGAEALLAAGADTVGATLQESRDQLYELTPLRPRTESTVGVDSS